jgi:hypothetical protein
MRVPLPPLVTPTSVALADERRGIEARCVEIVRLTGVQRRLAALNRKSAKRIKALEEIYAHEVKCDPRRNAP